MLIHIFKLLVIWPKKKHFQGVLSNDKDERVNQSGTLPIRLINGWAHDPPLELELQAELSANLNSLLYILSDQMTSGGSLKLSLSHTSYNFEKCDNLKQSVSVYSTYLLHSIYLNIFCTAHIRYLLYTDTDCFKLSHFSKLYDVWERESWDLVGCSWKTVVFWSWSVEHSDPIPSLDQSSKLQWNQNPKKSTRCQKWMTRKEIFQN